MAHDRIVAVGLLTQADVERLGISFSQLYQVEETPCFGELRRAIEEADRTARLAGEKQLSDSTP